MQQRADSGRSKVRFFVFHIIINYAYSYADDQLSAAVRKNALHVGSTFYERETGSFCITEIIVIDHQKGLTGLIIRIEFDRQTG